MMLATADRSANTFETDAELDAYNAAFEELGLNWHWDRTVLRQLAAITVESARIAEYVRRHQPHLLTAYPAEFLASIVTQTKSRLHSPVQRPDRR